MRPQHIAFLLAVILVVGCAPSSFGRDELQPDNARQDLTKPIEIEHRVLEIIANHKHPERYNFILYHFANEHSYISARSYLWEMDKVAVYGPFNNRESMKQTTDHDHFDQVIAYLRLRYSSIQVLSENGYETIWQNEKDRK